MYSCQNYFSDLEIFVNSWYNDEEEFIKFISESVIKIYLIQNINYKYLNGLFYTAQNILKMNKQQRKDFNQKIEV